jgi:hypothetical protein
MVEVVGARQLSPRSCRGKNDPPQPQRRMMIVRVNSDCWCALFYPPVRALYHELSEISQTQVIIGSCQKIEFLVNWMAVMK